MGPIMTTIHTSYNIIKNPEQWTQGFFQKDENGNNCKWQKGKSFCAMGAVYFVCANDNMDEHKSEHKAILILQMHSKKMFGGEELQTVNDSLPSALAHQNVLKIFKSVMDKFHDREPSEEEWNEDKNL